jgi:hypothetical protein
MALHWPFGHLKPKLWAKEGPGVKLAIWLLTTKSQESTSFRRRLEECDTALESSRQELQLWFKTCLDPNLKRGAVAVQSLGTSTWDNFGTPFRESQQNVSFGCSLRGEMQRILYGGRWWLPPSPDRGVSRGLKCPWLVPTPKGVLECELTTWVVCFDADSCLIY